MRRSKIVRAAFFWLVIASSALVLWAVVREDTDRATKQAAEVRQTELDFAAAARAKDYEKAMSYWDHDIMFFNDGKMSRGMEKQRANWEFLKNPNLTITWSPEVVEASGGLGYTTGPYEIRVKQADGSEKVQRGRYCTIWRRKPDGSWKAALDIGNPEPPEKK